jgi:hypothetical protein
MPVRKSQRLTLAQRRTLKPTVHVDVPIAEDEKPLPLRIPRPYPVQLSIQITAELHAKLRELKARNGTPIAVSIRWPSSNT